MNQCLYFNSSYKQENKDIKDKTNVNKCPNYGKQNYPF